MPTFHVNSNTTGLNIESFASPYNYRTYLMIKSITITVVPPIVGNNSVCSSETYTINTSSLVSWSIDPPTGIATLTSNGNQATLTRTSNGVVNLTASIAGTGCINTASKYITAGGNGYQMQIYGSNYVQCGDYVSYQVANAIGLAYNWTFPSDWNYAQGQGSSVLYVQPPYYGASSGYVNVTVYDGCDYYYSSQYVEVSCGGYYYTIGPNPSSSSVTVSVKESAAKESRITRKISELNIYDKLGNLRKRQKFNGIKRASLDISDLKQDVYMLEIVDGNFRERRKLSIVR